MNPPNFGVQEAVHGPECRTCTHYTSPMCAKYDLRVKPNNTCDSYDSTFTRSPS